MSDWIPNEEWETIVDNVPIVSVDLVVECPEGIVLGKRSNKPAKGKWFVPGGRVRKGESLEDAVHRVSMEELGVNVEICEKLGAFDHFYETSEVGGEKHYVAHGFRVWTENSVFEPDSQHGHLATFQELPQDTHEYVVDYLEEADLRSFDRSRV
ncbi:NUDIX domain-containing protein [Halorubrum sp. ASP1]|uniref:NUDIX domain-containing protein n=1 Tax=Halorubrum sp. ASP1 TaxID=2518114 RepID=UPI0010F7C710|nr:NUDIX domain-containing protein [Halorubrum sp. ASP1]TKX62978.1 NUDIX domain-containing protein [Halorubrum sp. ASP1]